MNRRALAIAAAGVVVVALVWYLALWRPQTAKLDQARQRRQAAEQAQVRLRAEIDRLEAAQREEPARRARLEVLRAAIPDEPNLAQLILDANEAATRSGIDFISIAPSLPSAPAAATGPTPTTAPAAATGDGATNTSTAPPAPAAAPRPAEIKLALSVQGGYFQVLDFLNRLDDLPRLVVTDAVNVTADPTARLTVGINARMFVRTIPPAFAPAGPATTPRPTTTTPTGGGR